MSDVVNQTTAGELPEPTSTTGREATEYTEDTEASQPREGVNTRDSDNEADENVQPLTEKASNRFEELRNKAEEYKTNWEQDRERLQQLEQQLTNQRLGQVDLGYMPGEAVRKPYQEFAQLELETKVTRLQEDLAWRDATAEYPELKDDKEFDDMVYTQYLAERAAGRNVTPLMAAKKVKKYLDNLTSKASREGYDKAENDVSEKTVISRETARRSPSASQGNQERMKNAIRKYNDTHDDSDLLDLLSY